MKLLYDSESESSLVTLTQTSILLAYYSSQFDSTPRKRNFSWLNEAIQNAVSLEAHIHASRPAPSREMHPAQWKRRNLLRRLWWCCIFCDRTLSLSARRSPYIGREYLHLDASPALGDDDLSCEVGRSQVYDAETKRRLINVLEQIAKLCTILADLLVLVYPVDGGLARQSRPRLGREAGRIKECKAAMTRWYIQSISLFSSPEDRSRSDVLHVTGTAAPNDPVTLNTNLMYMHYK